MKQIAICEEASVEISSYAKAEARKKSCARMLQGSHLESGPLFRFSRLGLSVESDCNVGCNYCDSKTNTESDGKVATAQEALERIQVAAKSDPRLRVIEISGSGDALASKVTFEILRMVKEEFPHFTLCVATNGLLLPKKLGRLKDLGVSAVNVAVNAVDSEVGARIYSFVRLNGKTLRGEEAFEVLSLNQLEGIRNAADAGMMVEITSACIPGVNMEHLVEVAKTARTLGVDVMNVEPVVPAGKLAGLPLASIAEVERVNSNCAEVYSSPDWLLNASPVVISCIFGGM